MKLSSFILFWIVAMLAFDCASFKKDLAKSGDRNEAIRNAIVDFSNTALYKRSPVFLISFTDTLRRMVLKKIDDGNYKWVNGEIYQEVIAIDIIASSERLLLPSDIRVGSNGKLPSQFVERDGKLFYWWDDDYLLTEEMLAVLKRHDLLQYDKGDGTATVPDFTSNDAQKGAHYYFCRNNLSQYKRVITSKGLGYYDPPKLNCSQ